MESKSRIPHGIAIQLKMAPRTGRGRMPMRMSRGGMDGPMAPPTKMMASGGRAGDEVGTPDINGDMKGIETNPSMANCPSCGSTHMCHGGSAMMAGGGMVGNMVGGRGPGMTAANGQSQRGSEAAQSWDGGKAPRQQKKSVYSAWADARYMQGR